MVTEQKQNNNWRKCTLQKNRSNEMEKSIILGKYTVKIVSSYLLKRFSLKMPIVIKPARKTIITVSRLFFFHCKYRNFTCQRNSHISIKYLAINGIFYSDLN